MSLYEISQLKKSLRDSYDPSNVVAAINELRAQIKTVLITVPIMAEKDFKYIQDLLAYYDDLIVKAQQPLADHRLKLDELNNEITDMAHVLYANSYDLEEHDGGVDSIRQVRVLPMYDEVKEIIVQRIRLYTNWKYPALEIGCRDGEWTEHLVAADPLYITDKYLEFLDSATSKFSEEYQRRLRRYNLNNYDFAALPQNQFGFIFSWNHFNYISLDTLTEVLKKIPNLLRPGGVFMFSYNDGDDPMGVGMAENFGQTYIPKSVLIPTCQSVGLEIIADSRQESNISWLEVRKPGTLKTVKAHQVLGKIERRIP